MSEKRCCNQCLEWFEAEDTESGIFLCDTCHDIVVKNIYDALFKILEEKYDVKIKYTIRKKTPEELAEEKKTGICKSIEWVNND